MSFGGTESGSSNSLNQEFTLLAAAGITPYAASGDGGSRPSNSTGLYSTSSSLSVSYPASDPYVIGVGGTTLSFDANYNYLSETTWFQNSGNNSSSGSGGGFSAIFSRPSWQAGTGVPTTNAARCVPDVSAVSNGSQPSSGNQQFGAFFVVGGQTDPNGEGVEGTSLATQVFAGLLADASQARGGQAFQAPLGQYLYPLIGTNAFNDITTGSNGISINGSIQYSATVGYDLCTGIGTPNMTNLVVALGGILPPTITSQPQSTTTTAGSSFSFSVTATGGGTLSYQWYLNGSAVSNQTSSTYFNGSATAGNAGSYTVVVSNAAGSVTSNAATLTVNGAAAAAPAPASSGGGGGGGAPSLWFYAALALVCAARGLIQGRDGRGRPSLPH